MTFMHASTLCRFRKRVGQDGIRLIEDNVFYPTDVRLLYKAFDKMAIVATKGKMAVRFWTVGWASPRRFCCAPLKVDNAEYPLRPTVSTRCSSLGVCLGV
jgi:hypothetical protein